MKKHEVMQLLRKELPKVCKDAASIESQITRLDSILPDVVTRDNELPPSLAHITKLLKVVL